MGNICSISMHDYLYSTCHRDLTNSRRKTINRFYFQVCHKNQTEIRNRVLPNFWKSPSGQANGSLVC